MRTYEVPQEGAEELRVGSWVEIFEAYCDPRSQAVRVRTMRVGAKKLDFMIERPGGNLLRPHEGKITQIYRSSGKAQFSINL
ncbi:hypothetical protein SAMN05660860_00630 [Geoalkalibacter ferrihydriticus]|uniref:Uncharacterized protein n=3 Tax=Geoalkalibacter ferrihydriticus TaxID=392333 RepID=A0A0C2HIQ4_9BACT|nr:hypothetical protein GFER_07545 [Geoalkalibacter ferrihydriticus DSM 17813]SDL43890.1 hypothetical protein SAMN05660860_00630 [Geoalkalibacter ferrihydriticus]